MVSGWRYRVVGTGGVAIASVVALLIANHATTQAIVTTYLPLFHHLSPVVLTGTELLVASGVSTTVVFTSLIPLYKPRPRRILDTILLAQKRVVVAIFALATIGYFNGSYRLPRVTLFMLGVILLLLIPGWFLLIRDHPVDKNGRALIIGDNADQIERAISAVDIRVMGYLSPPLVVETKRKQRDAVADGGVLQTPIKGIEYLGGISRLELMLVEHDIDTVVLAFENTDRGEFFGVLEICHEYGIEAKVLREHADSVLLTEETAGDLLTVDLEPWDWQERLFKRGFDIVFATIGLIMFAPVAGVIALAIKFDSSGPALYSQNRTADLGGMFRILKFRTMLPESEVVGPINDEDNDRITRIGRLLRKSHLDELPQLWAIFTGEMSVVGPRAVWTDEEALLEQQTGKWKKRWFVKPGLTGLAQINDVSSTDPSRKLRYDLEYIRHQSFGLDLKIVIRQIWSVLTDIYVMVRSDNRDSEDGTTDRADKQ